MADTVKLQLFNGLCDRIGSLMSFLLHARHLNKCILEVEDPPDRDLNGRLLDFFEIPDGVVVSPKLKNPHRRRLCCRTYSRRDGFALAADELRVTQAVAAEVQKTIDAIGVPYFAVHVRRTDKRGLPLRPYAHYFEILDACDDIIYLATDEASTQRDFVHRYGDRIKFYAPITNSETEKRNTPVLHAVVDLAMCIEGNEFLGEKCSGWFHVISAYRDSHQTMRGPRKADTRGSL